MANNISKMSDLMAVTGENAQVLGKNAACLLTISDSFVAPGITTAEERQKSFTDMMKVALGAEY